jgi:hypothetical protein
LRTELEQARIKIAEVEEHQGSLRSGYQKLEHECEGLRNAAEMLKQEKAEAEKTREAEVATLHSKFQDYHVYHCKKLRDFHFNLEKAVNEFGASCLPYPRKGSTIVKLLGGSMKNLKCCRPLSRRRIKISFAMPSLHSLDAL